MKIEQIKVKCQRCDHSWIYKGGKLEMLKTISAIYVGCPHCKTSVKIESPIVKKEKQ